jgi:malate dehydrogenase (oxaloacetate-decarboxylating)
MDGEPVDDDLRIRSAPATDRAATGRMAGMATAHPVPDSARPRPLPTSASYAITVRLFADPDPVVVGVIATAVGAAGGVVTAIDVTESRHDRITIDVTCSAADGEHAQEIVAALSGIDGVEVYRVSDRTFLLHLGGKIAVTPKVPLKTRDDLSMAYTPGVGRVSLAIAAKPDDVTRLTIKGNSVAVVTDGSAVLGLGNLGPGAALPVMEGKAALFKRFADIDAWPICLDTQDVEEIVATVRHIAPGFGGINLEDISAPRCFEIERRLRAELSIPVFHDDQHGTAIVVLAALTNALRCVTKPLADVRIVVCGGGAAGTAIVDLLLAGGAGHLLVYDREGILAPDDPALDAAKRSLAARTNPAGRRGELHDALTGADVFIGVSAPGILPAEWIADMARDPVVFALANPDPEVNVDAARRYAAILATGRSDYPNQINNVLAFPGVFRGLLDARAHQVSTTLLLHAADALAHCVSDEQLNASYIVPSVFDPHVPQAVAAAVRAAAESSAHTGDG